MCLTASIANVNRVVVRVRVVAAVAGLVESASHQGYPQHVPLFSRDRQGTSVPSSTRVPRWQLLKVCASFCRFNHTTPCAVKRAGIADRIGLNRHSPTAAGCGRNLKKKNRRTPSPGRFPARRRSPNRSQNWDCYWCTASCSSFQVFIMS